MGCGCSKRKGVTPKRQVVKKTVGTNRTTRGGIKRVRIKRNAFSV